MMRMGLSARESGVLDDMWERREGLQYCYCTVHYRICIVVVVVLWLEGMSWV
jgi:hypothetical protein